MRLGPLAVGLALLVAGCLGAVEESAVDDVAPAPSPEELVGRVENVSRHWPGAEPVVDVGPEGTIYVEGVGTYQPPSGPSRGVNKVFRSRDGRVWTDVTPKGPGQEATGDGYVAVDPDGTVYAANVFGLTFQVYRSEDGGRSWTPLNVPRLPALMHRHWIEARNDTVHVTVEALPPGALPIFVGGPPVEGQVDNPNTGMYYFRSTDGGDTWSRPVRIDPQINYVGQSDMAVGPSGEKVYVVRYRESDTDVPLEYSYDDGEFYLLAVDQADRTMQRKPMFDLNGSIGSALTSLEVGPSGRLSFVWAEASGNRSRIHAAVSDDQGDTWHRTELDVGNGTQAMPFHAVRSDGRTALIWYEANADGLPLEVDADWHVSAVEFASTALRNRTGPVRRTAWPVHQGNICVKGPACGEGEDRSLLDYPWVTYGPEGRAHLAWASTMWDKPSAFPAYGRLSGPGAAPR